MSADFPMTAMVILPNPNLIPLKLPNILTETRTYNKQKQKEMWFIRTKTTQFPMNLRCTDDTAEL